MGPSYKKCPRHDLGAEACEEGAWPERADPRGPEGALVFFQLRFRESSLSFRKISGGGVAGAAGERNSRHQEASPRGFSAQLPPSCTDSEGSGSGLPSTPLFAPSPPPTAGLSRRRPL